jgi:hypothetical protein
MAGVTGQFAGALQQKYDLQRQGLDAQARLSDAQADTLRSRSPFENALADAQAYQTRQQGATLGPLADASIAATRAGIGETAARTGLYGAEGAQIYDGLAPIGPLGARGLYRGQQSFYNPGGFGGGQGNAPIASPTPSITSQPLVSTQRSILDGGPMGGDPNDPLQRRAAGVGGAYAKGTARVPAMGKGPVKGSIAAKQPPMMPPMSLHDKLMGRGSPGMPAYAFGTRNVPVPTPAPAPAPVPGPNDTTTSGQWGPGQNQTLRDRIFGPKMFAMGTSKVPSMGFASHFADGVSDVSMFGGDTGVGGAGVYMGAGDRPLGSPGSDPGLLFAKGSAKVPHRGGGKGKAPSPALAPGPMPPGAPMLPPGMPMPAQGGAPMPGPGVMPPGMSPGLAGMLQAALGAPRVPGMTPPPGMPQDVVPSMLTPGEAVLTPGAAQAAGRDKIAALNAKHPPRPSGPAQKPGMGMVKKGGKPMPKPAGHTINIHMK